ncbi:MAG: acyl-CoA carboxylase subunit epsilon [Micrococcales bacterium]|nr:acyl-CoA carboxylase subunit epsilon [Micrococcales bacterium]
MSASDGVVPDLRFLSGDPTPEELAAVTAVLGAAIEQLAQEDRTEPVVPSTWMRTRRAIRPVLTGDWTHPA